MELPHSTTGPETSGFTRRVPAMRLGRRLATIAVLGMSGTGQIMVNALKLSGHNVIVYDKDVLQCFRFTPLGIKVASSVRDAFDKADVTFGCVESDQDALEVCRFADRLLILFNLFLSQIFEGWCSILFSKSISNRKGYIEMMGVNKIISTNYRDLINSRGGLYLEAQVIFIMYLKITLAKLY